MAEAHMKVVVTGGAGFLGSALCHLLTAERGLQTVSIDCPIQAASLEAPAPIINHRLYSAYQVDVSDRTAVTDILRFEQPDVILHVVANSEGDRSTVPPAPGILMNIAGTNTMLEATSYYWSELPQSRKAAFRFVLVSTDETSCGHPDVGGLDHVGDHAASKVTPERLALAWHRTYGLPVIVADCPQVYGPGQSPEKLIPLMITNARMGRDLPVCTDGSQSRGWLYVEDAARALWAIARTSRAGSRRVVGSRRDPTTIEIVSHLCKLLDETFPRPDGAPHSAAFVSLDARDDLHTRDGVDPSRFERETGWAPAETMTSALSKTITWYTAHESWWMPLRLKAIAGVAGQARENAAA